MTNGHGADDQNTRADWPLECFLTGSLEKSTRSGHLRISTWTDPQQFFDIPTEWVTEHLHVRATWIRVNREAATGPQAKPAFTGEGSQASVGFDEIASKLLVAGAIAPGRGNVVNP